jgi:hypothetical protein
VPYLRRPDGAPHNAETFDVDEYLGQFDLEWLKSPAGRRELTRDDPLLWSCLYTPELIKNIDGEITFSDVHLGIYRDALDLRQPAGPEGSRIAYVAPRGSGKARRCSSSPRCGSPPAIHSSSRRSVRQAGKRSITCMPFGGTWPGRG